MKKRKTNFKGSMELAEKIREDHKNGLTIRAIVLKYARQNIKFSSSYVGMIIKNQLWKKPDMEKINYLSNLIKNGDNSYLQKGIEYLSLPTRAFNSLHNAEITTIGQLLSYSEVDLMEFDKFGKTSLYNIKERLATIGLNLKNSFSQYNVTYNCYVKPENRTYWKKIQSQNMGTITIAEFYSIVHKDRTDSKEILKKRWDGAKITTFSPDKTKKTVYDYTAKW